MSALATVTFIHANKTLLEKEKVAVEGVGEGEGAWKEAEEQRKSEWPPKWQGKTPLQ